MDLSVAWLIRTQIQKLWFKMKVRETKQPATGSYVYLGPKWRYRLWESSEFLCLRAVSSHLTFFSLAGIKGVHHYSLKWQTSCYCNWVVCHPGLTRRAEQWGCCTLCSFRQALFIKKTNEISQETWAKANIKMSPKFCWEASGLWFLQSQKECVNVTDDSRYKYMEKDK